MDIKWSDSLINLDQPMEDGMLVKWVRKNEAEDKIQEIELDYKMQIAELITLVEELEQRVEELENPIRERVFPP